jgi:hypothetical protein
MQHARTSSPIGKRRGCTCGPVLLLISNGVQLQLACSLHTCNTINALEKDHGTNILTHADMPASAQTMEAPGSAPVGDGTAAVDWGSDGEEEEGEGGLCLELGAGEVGLGADAR